MAGSFSDVTENAVLDLYFNGNSSGLANDPTLFLALFTIAPTDAGGGTEVSGGTYARCAMDASSGGDFIPAAAGVISNASIFTFATATAPWGTIVAVGIYTAVTGGTFLMWGDLLVNKAVTTGDVVKVLVSNLSITLS